jgi:hypothetical protein
VYKTGTRNVQKREKDVQKRRKNRTKKDIRMVWKQQPKAFRYCGEMVATRKHEGLWGKAGGRENDDFRRNVLPSKEHGVMGKTYG